MMKKREEKHKLSYAVFLLLRLIVVVIMVRQIALHNYESSFLCILALLLFYMPKWIQLRLPIELPQPLEITLLCFIFAAAILGEVNAFYIIIPGWDVMLHTINGFLAAAVGFSLVTMLNDQKRVMFALSPFFQALTAFCFSMTIGVLWEFIEFGMDCFFHTDMQKDTIIHSIYTVTLDSTRSNCVIAVKDIQDVVVNSQSLGLKGYLDVGLIDTMKDLFVNFIGALVFSVVGFFCINKKGLWRLIKGFIPYKRYTEEKQL